MSQVINQEKAATNDEPFKSIFANPDLEQVSSWLPLANQKVDYIEPVFQGRLFEKVSKTPGFYPYHYELYSDKLIRIKHDTDFVLYSAPEPSQLIQDRTQSTYQTSTNRSQKSPVHFQQKQQLQLQSIQLADQEEEQKQSVEDTNSSNNFLTSYKDSIDNWYTEKYENAVYLPINQMYLKRLQYSEEVKSPYKFGVRISNSQFKCQLFTQDQDYFLKWHGQLLRYCLLNKFVKRYKILTKMKTNAYPFNSIFYYKCYSFIDLKQYSIRIIDKVSLSDQNKQIIVKELAILRKLDHITIQKVLEVYEDQTNVFIITEMIPGRDLQTHIQAQKYFDEKQLLDIMWNLLLGLAHMHQKNIYHRDIKLENIMLRNPSNLGDLCIINFFMADFIDDKQEVGKKCGTAGYIAPEIFLQKKYDAKVDIFSLGVILYQLMYQKSPFDSPNKEETLKLNEMCNINFNQDNGQYKYTSSCKDFLLKMLEKDPTKRYTATKLLNHSWFVNHKKRSDRYQAPFSNLPSLSTIIENELNSEHSPELHYMFPLFAQDQKSSLELNEEFQTETLECKMTVLNKQNLKGPSKSRHETTPLTLLTQTANKNQYKKQKF